MVFSRLTMRRRKRSCQACVRSTSHRRGGANPQREGLSLDPGSPEGGRKLRAESATLRRRLPPRYDCRKIPTFVARISQTARDAGVTFLMNDGTGSVFSTFFSLTEGSLTSTEVTYYGTALVDRLNRAPVWRSA